MTANPPLTPATPGAPTLTSLRSRARGIAATGLLRVVRPYARHRGRQAEMADTLRRLAADFEHVRERHTEQLERLEDLARELVLTAESLRRDIARREPRDGN